MNSSTRAERGSCALACGHSTGALGTDVLGGAHVPRPIPTLPASTVRWVACGHAHVAVVTTSHELLVLGDNSHGQLGLGDLRARSTPQRVAPQVLQVGAGHSHTLFTTLNGSLFSFGSNSCGQLGQPPERSLAMEPELVQTVSGAVCLFACGDHHSVVVTDAHARAVQAFGNNDHGQLGLGTKGPAVFEASAVDLDDRPLAVAAGRYHTLLVGHRGGVYACGRNASGQLGLDSPESVSKPARIRLLDELLRASLDSSGVRGWGDDGGGDSVRAVACGAFHSLALTRRGRVVSWGGNAFGQLGIGLVGSECSGGYSGGSGAGGQEENGGGQMRRSIGSWHAPSFVEIDSWRQPLDEVVGVACGAEHSLFLSVSGEVFASGCNAYGQLGHAPQAQSSASSSSRLTPMHNVSSTRPPAHTATATACTVLPRRIEQGDARIRAVFGGGDMTVCLPVTGASVEQLRSRELQRQLQASLGYVDLLKAAVDASTLAAADSHMSQRQAEVRASKNARAEERLQRALSAISRVGGGQAQEVSAILDELSHVVAGYNALVDKQRENAEEVEALKKRMGEESARALQRAKEDERAAEERHQQELLLALAEKAAMQDKLKKLQQEKLSAEELLEAERQEHEEEERAREAAKKRENARLLQEQRDRERALAEERAAEEENAVHRVRSVADEEEEGQAHEATPSPTPSPSPPPSPDISASAQQDQSVAAQDSKDLALLGEGQRDIRQIMSFLVDMVEERELGVEGVVALWLEQTVAAACRRAEGRELGANVNVQEQSIAEVVAWLVGEVEAQAQAETETGNVAVDADAGAGAREGAIAEVVAWIVGEVEAQVTDTRDDDAGKEEREKVIMEVVSWMVGEVAARVQETVVDTRGDDVGKEEREKIVREVVSWLVGRVEAQVEDAHEAQVEEEQVGSRPSEEAAESRPKGSWSFPEKRYSGRATFKFGVTFKDLTVNVGSKEEGMAQLQAAPDQWEGLQVFEKEGYKKQYTLIKAGCDYHPVAGEEEDYTWVHCKYDLGLGVAAFTDEFSEGVLASGAEGCGGRDMSASLRRVGRGQGLYDKCGLKLFGAVHPEDVVQGGLGDCWLMCSMSAVAEHDGLIQKLFAQDSINMEGRYTVRLFDLPSGAWKEYDIDDRLFTVDGGGNPRFGQASPDLEVWSPLLEKAFAVHAGGWRNMEGGWPAVALACLTGCTDIVTIRNTAKSRNRDQFLYSMASPNFAALPNHCHVTNARVSSRVSGGFDGGADEVSAEALFEHLCAWDAALYICTASTGGPGDSGDHDHANEGLADNHAYSLIAARKGVCGGKFDLVCFRNPWGRKEFTGGGWYDGGPKWQEYPLAAAELGYVQDENDGLFWMEWQDATDYFWEFTVCKLQHTGGKKNKAPVSAASSDARTARCQAPLLDKVAQAVKTHIFDALDASGDGVLSAEELRALARRLPALGQHNLVPVSGDKIRAMLEEFLPRVDANGDGTVTWSEFWDCAVKMYVPDGDLGKARAAFDERVSPQAALAFIKSLDRIHVLEEAQAKAPVAHAADEAPLEEERGRKGRQQGPAEEAAEEEEEMAADVTDTESDDDGDKAGGAGQAAEGQAAEAPPAARARKAGAEETPAEAEEEGGSDVPDSDDDTPEGRGGADEAEVEQEGGPEKLPEAETTRARKASGQESAEEEAEEEAADASESDEDVTQDTG